MGRRVNLADLASEDTADGDPRPPRRANGDSGSVGAAPAAVTTGAAELLVADIVTNPLNERDADSEDPEELAQLAETITQHGVLQPLIVCTVSAFLDQFPQQRQALAGARWVTLIGNRRLAAARIAGVERVRAIHDAGGLPSMYEVMLVENSHRKDLAPLHEADAIRRVLDREGLSQRELGKRIGRTHTYIQQRLTLLDLVPALRDALAAGHLTVERARQLGTLTAEEQNAIAAAGAPYRAHRGGNGVATRARRPYIPTGDPAAAARSIKSIYTGDELAELIRLLSTAEQH